MRLFRWVPGKVKCLPNSFVKHKSLHLIYIHIYTFVHTCGYFFPSVQNSHSFTSSFGLKTVTAKGGPTVFEVYAQKTSVKILDTKRNLKFTVETNDQYEAKVYHFNYLT